MSSDSLGDGVLTSQHAHSRFLSSFGPLNQYLTIANHTLVLVDSMSLVSKERSMGGVKGDGDVLPKELDEAKFWPSIASGVCFLLPSVQERVKLIKLSFSG